MCSEWFEDCGMQKHNYAPPPSPLSLYSPLPQDYLKLATAGAACNAVVRFVLHPLDCVKTTVQAEMGKEPTVGDAAADEEREVEGKAGEGWVGTVKGIIKKGGWGELARGIDVSTVRGSVAVELGCFPSQSSTFFLLFFNLAF